MDLVLTENTHKSKTLLNKYEIKNKISLFNDFTAENKIDSLIEKILTGKNIAMISDAGTPLISDPGSELVKKAIEKNIDVVPIPGASSVISALIASGLKTESFTFRGFLPKKENPQINFLKEIKFKKETQIFFESPKRIKKSLKNFQKVFEPERKIVLAREMTKIYEEFYRGTIYEVVEKSDLSKVIEKGEYVILLDGTEKEQIFDSKNTEILFNELKPFMTLRQISKIISKVSTENSKEIYNFFKKK